MARAETIVQLTDDLRGRLDAEAGRRGISRSALLREAAELYLAVQSEAAITAALVEGYTRIPQDEPDEWGSLIDDDDDEVSRHIDHEERQSGLGPW